MKIKILIAVLFISTLYFVSCKEPDSIGLDLIENELNGNTIDTLTLFAYSEIEDSVMTYYSHLYHLVGNYMDPIFGEVTTSFYTQINIEENQFNFGTDPQVDSIILMLDVINEYGNSESDMNFRVFEVTEDFYKDSIYYLSDKLEYKLIPIADTSFAPTIGDSIIIEDSKKVKFHLRIKLDKSFANELIELSELGAYESFDNFVKEMKGLYVETNKRQGGGSILSVSLSSSLSKVILYYNDSLNFSYPIDSDCGRFTHAEHDYNYANSFLKAQLDGDTSSGSNYMFVQPLAGIMTKIQIPYLKELANFGDIGINNARLIIEVDNEFITDTVLYPLPKRLALAKKNENGSLYFIIDESEDENVDGNYYPEINSYIFNITRHLQERIINHENEYSLYLMTRGKAVSADRVVLKGSQRTDGKMIVKLVYTKF